MMEEKAVIYVAGNPDAYPVEYYDADSQIYEGVIPHLLQEFSAQSSYELVYYQADGKDHRAQLARNQQVDLVSGYAAGETVPGSVETIPVFRVKKGETEISYDLHLTKAAPESLKAELESFLASVSQEEVSGLLLDTAAAPHNSHAMFWTVGTLSLVIALLLAALAVLLRSNHKKLKQLRKNLETDEITGLGNTEYLMRYYRQLIHDQNRILYQLFYFYVDTDRLRRISSSRETDEFLCYCAKLLTEYTADTDILARVSEHGFVLLKLVGDTCKRDMWLHTLLERVHEYPRRYAKPFDVNMSVGIYPIKQQDRDLGEMIFDAAQSAYAADRDGKEILLCSEEILQKLIREKQLQENIEDAFARQEFQLYLQFYVDANTLEIVGGEALSRWHHPQRGVLLPGAFVPIMEREKIISKLDYYCLQKTCAFLQSLVAQKVDTFFISCNFSRETFAAVDFVEQVKKIVERYHFPRKLLIFEITESASVKNVSQIQENIIALKEYGVSIVLDDFGEGFTSFYDLHQYPMDGIKLDKRLVDHSMTPGGKAVLKAMIEMGHELGLAIWAEGVEQEEQVKVLQSVSCDAIQGFLFFVPLPEWEAENQILKRFLKDPPAEEGAGDRS